MVAGRAHDGWTMVATPSAAETLLAGPSPPLLALFVTSIFVLVGCGVALLVRYLATTKPTEESRWWPAARATGGQWWPLVDSGGGSVWTTVASERPASGLTPSLPARPVHGTLSPRPPPLISCGRRRTRWPGCDVPVPSPLRRSWQQRPPTLLSTQHVACHLTTRGGRCLCCCRQGLPQRPHQIPLIQGGKSQPATRYKMY